MSTKKKYLELWKTFDEKLKENNLNIKGFAKKWEKVQMTKDSENDSAIYRTFLKKIKAQYDRSEGIKNVRSSTIEQVEEYIKFLDDGYFTQELLEDEKVNSWFD